MTAHEPDGREDATASDREPEHLYLCIDLKSFYASVECVDRGFDPFKTNLVVADPSRGRSTICLAITPAMKALGVRNRCRLFEIPADVEYRTARPNMRHYMEVSAQIYGIYLEYVSPQDVHVYSVDECFIDVAPYLRLYRTSARELARRLMAAVRGRTGICATVGIGPNLFLAKVALDITAKHVADNIGCLDEEAFRRIIWPHRPITDIWGIGGGTARRLARYGVRDLMGVAALDPGVLYREFGVTAEYLIDHAFGRERCTIADIRRYRPAATSMVNGQVLPENYTCDEARNVLHEMVELSVLDLVERGEVADHLSLHVGYARRARLSGARFIGEHGPKRIGGRPAAEHGGKSRKIPVRTNSRRKLLGYFDELFEEAVDPARDIRRISIGFGNLLPEELAASDLFCDTGAEERERDLLRAVIAVKHRFGKNSLLTGANFAKKATGRERNEQIGGHHA
ncbi:DNA-directed DNA polymerase [Coriobacterium glomerans PW2]|uniref:DNA-directed DNA polymerase n=1 Tax=Coriobacterium glomerans (strain ATCC 49209 / DSM 20642 / JCM 10262 / PW2) TaxID=700015 RepID=F2N7J6_CORGP|nr:DNA repair protein [Coriobacterium glomerans]AEB06812.1 DNA-directed DNA polymerase [Coriobacterium glomerans PW2]